MKMIFKDIKTNKYYRVYDRIFSSVHVKEVQPHTLRAKMGQRYETILEKNFEKRIKSKQYKIIKGEKL